MNGKSKRKDNRIVGAFTAQFPSQAFMNYLSNYNEIFLYCQEKSQKSLPISDFFLPGPTPSEPTSFSHFFFLFPHLLIRISKFPENPSFSYTSGYAIFHSFRAIIVSVQKTSRPIAESASFSPVAGARLVEEKKNILSLN